MRSLSIAILGTWLLSAAPVHAEGWCWASRLTCPDCEHTRSWTPRERWKSEVSRDEAYHEIFGDGPGHGGGRRRRRKKAAAKTAAAPAGAATAAPGAPTAPPADAAPPPPDAAPPPADAAPPPPADAHK